MESKITNKDEAIKLATLVHGDEYDYSMLPNEVNCDEKYPIICHKRGKKGKEHGAFLVYWRSHLVGSICPRCAGSIIWTTEEFIKRARRVHGDKYDYSKVVYVNGWTKVCIICPIHGEFWQIPRDHLSGHGCKYCRMDKMVDARLTKWEDLEPRLIETHKGKYNYDGSTYTNIHSKMRMFCEKHGEFWQSPHSHLAGRGCPKCKSSRLETIVINALEENHVEYEYQVMTDKLGFQTIDFYIPSKNTYIECQGEQHFAPIQFGGMSFEDAKVILEERKKLDEVKYNYVVDKGSEMIYFAMPKMYNDTSINVHDGFYSDKQMFEDVYELIAYILNKNEKND